MDLIKKNSNIRSATLARATNSTTCKLKLLTIKKDEWGKKPRHYLFLRSTYFLAASQLVLDCFATPRNDKNIFLGHLFHSARMLKRVAIHHVRPSGSFSRQ